MVMPEEINRILTDRISSLLFCPSKAASDNLEKEGFLHFDNRIVITGDVMYDAYLHFSDFKQKPNKFAVPEKFCLATLHRAENTGQAEILSHIIEALNSISAAIPIILPLHPRTLKVMSQNKITKPGKNIRIVEPVGYLEMIYLLEKCTMVLTDSGGLQKEAYFAERPCITLRNETEWTELVESGYNAVAGTSKVAIVQAFDTFLARPPEFKSGLYGMGNASEMIVSALESYNS